jgi:hypothetical protein
MRLSASALLSLWLIKTKRRRVFDAGGASLGALHSVVFDRYERPGNERESSTAKIRA